jgi:Terminase large subunit, T4likevirus-type, N-terminal
MSQSIALNLELHEKQGIALESLATEILFGGAAGGGKSHFLRIASIIWATEIPGLQVYLFRRLHDDLKKNHMEGPKGYRALLAPWVDAGFVSLIEEEIRFWNGSKIYLCHVKDEKHRFKYQGSEIHVLLIDELTHFTEVIYRFLRNRVRAVGLNMPAKYKGSFPRILCGSNPGNIGHHWVKKTFIDGAQVYELREMPNDEGGMLRQFIPARLEDNPSMMEDDPGYEARLEGLGSETLVRAMRDGDWDIVEGAYFTEFERQRHVLRPVELPEYWQRFRAADWGSAKPFCVLWFAVVTDEWQHPDGKPLPRGALIAYREWYGCRVPNEGLKMTAKEVALGIKQREDGDGVSETASVIDPATFIADGGPSIAERMFNEGVRFRQADNRRVARHGAMGGWDMLRHRLKGDLDGRPMLYFFETCIHTIRTLPALQHDASNPEDVDTDSEDHAADTVRYACMSRPWIRKAPEPPKKTELRNPTLGELTEMHDKRMRSRHGRIG